MCVGLAQKEMETEVNEEKQIIFLMCHFVRKAAIHNVYYTTVAVTKKEEEGEEQQQKTLKRTVERMLFRSRHR